MKTLIFTVRRPRRGLLRIPILCRNYFFAGWHGIRVLAVEFPLAVNYPFQKVASAMWGNPCRLAFFDAFDVARVENGRCVPVFRANPNTQKPQCKSPQN